MVKAKFLGTEAPTERGAQGAVGAIRKVLDKSMLNVIRCRCKTDKVYIVFM